MKLWGLRTAFVMMISWALCADAQAAKYLGNIWQLWVTTEEAEPIFTELFDQVTTQKWGQWSHVEPTRGTYIWDTLNALYGWADKTGAIVKEHCFIWHNSEPRWLDTSKAPYNRPDSVKAMVYKWMSDYLKKYGSRTDMIDVLNEPIEGNNRLKIRELLGGSGTTGWDWVVWPYQTARDLCKQYAPNAKLILNEFSLLGSDNKTTKFLEIVKVLKDRNLVDAIGEQGHFFEGVILNPTDAKYMDTAVIRRNLNRLAATGLPLHISEFDMSLADDQEQLRAYKILFPLLWEHGSVVGVTLWGYSKEDMWRPNAILVRPDGTERPALTWLRSYLAKTPITNKNIPFASSAGLKAASPCMSFQTGRSQHLQPVINRTRGNGIEMYQLNGSRVITGRSTR